MAHVPSNARPRSTDQPIAHLAEEGRPHLLLEHLQGVAARAERFAAAFAARQAFYAGLWHDIGKYGKDFQNRIWSENGFEAHLEDAATQRDHSTAGAIHAHRVLGAQGTPLVFAIAGHHAGLADRAELAERLKSKQERYATAMKAEPPAALLATEPMVQPDVCQSPRGLEMWTRFLFSALCDADFLDTEAFYDAGRAAMRGGGASLEELAKRLDHHLDGLQFRAATTEVNRVRAEVLAACRAAARQSPGLFSLTVPTGGGKTLAAMAFGLAHARYHGLERVIVAIPFTSIIEQNAAVYRTALGDDEVIEHHSTLDPERETYRNRVASENWDARVVVTTTVQLFESLFANRPGRCRKLHRLARSVIVLDEAQTLPTGLLLPILDALGLLAERFGSTIVFATATQPALGRSPSLPDGLPGIREIVPTSMNAFARLHRVRVRTPSLIPTRLDDLADEIAREPDVLVIVHRRDDARELTKTLDARLGHHETMHLSALMCAEHRAEVLALIHQRKRVGLPVRLVATQLVEAGVDLDFPVVYRALGGLDAMAQAAGRCNREGRLPDLGELRIFTPFSKPPPGVAETAQAVARGLLANAPDLDLFASASQSSYFERLYGARDLDDKRIQEARRELRFREVAGSFRMIEDDWSAPIVVPFGDAAARVAAIAAAGPSRARLRALQRFLVNVPRRAVERWQAEGLAEIVAETVTVLPQPFAAAYDSRFGLVPEWVGIADAASLIIEG